MKRMPRETKRLVLRYLLDKEATSTEVARFLGISVAGASSYLRKLSQEGLVRREAIQDGRAYIYILTPQGRRWLSTRG